MDQQQAENAPLPGGPGGEESLDFSPNINFPEAPYGGEKIAELFTTGASGEGDGGDAEFRIDPRRRLDHLRVLRDTASGLADQVSKGEPAQKLPGAKRGRPPVFDEIAKAKALGLLTAGLSQRAAAMYLGIDHTTISKAIKADPHFARQVRQAQAAARVHPRLTIVAASHKSWHAARYLLESNPEPPDDEEA